MKDELKKAIEEFREAFAEYKRDEEMTSTEWIYERADNALDIAIKEIEEGDELDKERIAEVTKWKNKTFENDNRIKELGLKLDAYSTHNIDRTFEKDELVNRIASLEAENERLKDGIKYTIINIKNDVMDRHLINGLKDLIKPRKGMVLSCNNCGWNNEGSCTNPDTRDCGWKNLWKPKNEEKK